MLRRTCSQTPQHVFTATTILLALTISATHVQTAFALVTGMEITGGEGNRPLTDPGWPVGAAAIFNSDVVCVPKGQVVLRPENMSAAVGAAIPVNFLTAYQLVRVMGGLGAGETMLVHSAGNSA